MPLSEIWTLQAAAGGDEKTLAEWGVSSASRSSAIQGDDTVTLGYALDDVIAAPDLFAWETEVIIRRAGQVYYRGYVAETSRSLSDDSETTTLQLRSQWWLLSRLTYRQEWPSLTDGGSMGTARTGRARLGTGSGGSAVAAMLSELAVFAVSMGVPLSFDLASIPSRKIPPVEGHNRTVADLIRDILRWYPDLALVPGYSESGTVYRARLSSGATPARIIDVGGAPLASLDVAALPERQVDAVHVIYEALADETTSSVELPGSEPAFASAPRLAAIVDAYPIGSAITRRTLTITLPYPAPPAGERVAPPAQPTPTSQPIVSETWPVDGATNVPAQQWWLDRSSLGALGLTANDILLPSSSDETTRAHRVIIDPATIPLPPSAVNPNSTPAWRPAVTSDTPRELISGALADWMPGRLKAYSLIAEVTIAVRQATVTAMSAERKAAFLRLGPREKRIQGADAYLLDALYKFTGTNALTRVYTQTATPNATPPGGDSGGANRESYNEARAAAVVPDLARHLYTALSPLHYQGSVPLVEEEAPLDSPLGGRLALSHPARPEWLAMAAQISQSTVDLASGRQTLTFGPPAHLGARDYADLYAAVRATQARRTEAAAAPQPVANPAPAQDDGPPPEPPRNAVVGGSITPKAEFRLTGGALPISRVWDLDIVDSGSVKVRCGTILRTGADVTQAIPITAADATFALSAGQTIRLKLSGNPVVVTLESGGQWADYPEVYETTGTGAAAVFQNYFYPLWQIVSTAGPDTVEIGSGLHARRLAGDHHFLCDFAAYQTGSNRPYVAPFLLPYHRVISP